MRKIEYIPSLVPPISPLYAKNRIHFTIRLTYYVKFYSKLVNVSPLDRGER